MMTNGFIVFISSLENNMQMLIVNIILSLGMYIFVFRKFYKGYLDPFFICIISSALASVVPLMMFQENMFFNNEFFFIYILSEIFFVGGILLFSQCNNEIFFCYHSLNIKEEQYWFAYISIVFVLSNILYFSFNGIPLFYEGGRLGISQEKFYFINKFIEALLFIFSFFLFRRIIVKRTFINTFLLIFLLGTVLLQGAKSSVLNLGIVCFFLSEYLKYSVNNNERQLGILLSKYTPKVFFIAIAFALIPLLVTHGDFETALINFGIRLIAFGDGFAYFYSDNWYGRLEIKEWYYYFLYPTFAVFKIIPYSETIDAIGFQLFREATGLINVFVGPNPRHNLIGLLYFGAWGSLIYSFCVGITVGFFTRYIYSKKIKMNEISYCIYAQIYCFATNLPTDFGLAFRVDIIGLQIFILMIGELLRRSIFCEKSIE